MGTKTTPAICNLTTRADGSRVLAGWRPMAMVTIWTTLTDFGANRYQVATGVAGDFFVFA